MAKCRKCNKTASYNYSYAKKGEYCQTHKLEKMINITIKYCDHENCKRKRLYNYKGHKAKYCKEHKLEEMVNVENKMCEKFSVVTLRPRWRLRLFKGQTKTAERDCG